jgi:hypothetical protein
MSMRNRLLQLQLQCCALSLAILIISLCSQATAQDASSEIKAEIERLQQSLKDKPISNPDLPEIGTMLSDGLKTASAALATGHVYMALEQLSRTEDLLYGVRTISEKAEAVKSGMPAYEAEWEKASLELASIDKKARARNWSHTSVGAQALAELAQGRALPLLEGSRGFAMANGPKDGLLYMGESQGQTTFAGFVYQLSLPRKNARPPLRSLLPELMALQEKTNAAFQPPKSIDMHPRFIALNSTIKTAGELDASKSYAGAMYQYLDAVRHYSMLDPAVPDAAKQSELRSKLAQELKKTEASKQDDSILQILLERGAGWLNKPDGAAPADDEWRAVRAIVEQVTPAYYAALKPAAAPQLHAGKTATLTLVRWPYT